MDAIPSRSPTFVTGSIFDVRPAPDGKTVVFTYGSEPRDAVLVKNFR
jgi:hypothetical protein